MFEIRPYKMTMYKDGVFDPMCDTYSSDIDSCVPLAEGMPIPKLSNDGNRVKTSVFSEGRRDDLKRVRVSLETVRFHTLQRMSVGRQEPRNVDLRRSSASNQRTGNLQFQRLIQAKTNDELTAS